MPAGRDSHAATVAGDAAAPVPASAPAARGFFGRFVLALAVIASLHVAIAVLVDPRGDFDTGRFPTVTRDARRAKMARFASWRAGGEVTGIVLGSSRVMQLAPRELAARLGGRFYNFAVDSARAEDDLAILRWLHRRHVPLREVVVGLDVEALHDDDVPDDRFSANLALQCALDGKDVTIVTRARELLGRIKSTFSLNYLRDVGKSLAVWHRHEPLASSFEDDGYLRYWKWEQERAAGTFDLARHIEDSKDEYRRRFGDMKALSPTRRADLVTLVDEARAMGAEVRIVITPVHPTVAAELARTTRYPALLAATQQFTAELARHGARTLDASDAQRAGLELTREWYDGAHVDEHNASRLVDAIAR